MNLTLFKQKLNEWVVNLNQKRDNVDNFTKEIWIREFFSCFTYYFQNTYLSGSFPQQILYSYSSTYHLYFKANSFSSLFSLDVSFNESETFLNNVFNENQNFTKERNEYLASQLAESISILFSNLQDSKFVFTGYLYTTSGMNIKTGVMGITLSKKSYSYTTFKNNLITLFTSKMNVGFGLGNEIFVNEIVSAMSSFVSSMTFNLTSTVKYGSTNYTVTGSGTLS